MLRRDSDARAIAVGAAGTGVVAGAVFLLALANGGYDLRVRAGAAIAAWWALLLVVALARPTVATLRRVAPLALLLVAYALWTLLSAAWATDAERVVAELNYPLLYLGVFLLAAAVAHAAGAVRVCDGLALGGTAVGILALASRLDPGLISLGGAQDILPAVETRLSYPLGYWNGLGILLALTFPLLLRIAVDGESAVVRGAALAPVPALAAAIYLTSSRGAVGVAGVGAIVFAVAARRRWPAVAAVAVAAAGSLVAVRAVVSRDELVNGPLGSSLAVEQGHSAAAAVAAVCVATALAWAAATLAAYGRLRVPRQVAGVALGLLIVASAAGLLLADPAARFRDFRRPPPAAAIASGDFVGSHLASSNGSGRWQFWERAAAAFRDEPLHGLGAGSYEAWWARTGTIPDFVRDAHSLYLESLGELGIIGFVLVVAIVATLIGSGVVWRRRAATTVEAGAAAAVIAVSAGFAVAAALDWVWELPAVAAFAFAAGGVAAGASRSDRGPPLSRTAATAFAAAAFAVVVVSAVQYLAETRLAQSRDDARAGALEAAADDAAAARALAPWAASPRLQLALVEERRGALAAARRSALEAVDRAPDDWRTWVTAARIDTKLGRVADARREIEEARRLNPRSPLFERRR